MDFFRLHPVTYQPADIIEGYENLIWTERYLEASEFQVKSFNVKKLRAELPLNGLVSLRDSRMTMIVESQAIDAEGRLTIKGRSFETFLENRTSLPNAAPGVDPITGNENVWEITDKSPGAAAQHMIKSHITDGVASPYDVMPTVVAVNQATSTEVVAQYKILRADLYSEVRKVLNSAGLGIKTVRPSSSSPNLAIVIYNGLNLTKGQSVNPRIVFRADAGHVLDPTYLFTTKEYKNVAYVTSKANTRGITAPGVPDTITGLARRVMYVDADDVAGSAFGYSILESRALQAMAEFNQKNFFEGEIAPDTPYKYNTDYRLGDRCTLVAEYGLNSTIMVNEYIRTQDEEGESGYPTFSVISG